MNNKLNQITQDQIANINYHVKTKQMKTELKICKNILLHHEDRVARLPKLKLGIDHNRALKNELEQNIKYYKERITNLEAAQNS